MKKVFLFLAVMAIAGLGYSQVDPETLSRQQQKEQQELLKQQQKEQEALEKQQQKEQEKALKEQEKAEADAEKAQRREQEKMMAKQAKKAHRAERREEIGRGLSFSIDPYAGLGLNYNSNDGTDLFAGWQEYLGAQVMLHYPLFKRWDLNFGLGVMADLYCLRNNANFNADSNILVEERPSSYISERDLISSTFIQLPIYLSHVSDNKNELYFGIKPAFDLKSSFSHVTVDGNNTIQQNGIAIDPNTMMNRFRMDVVLGSQRRFFIFDLGYELFFNLLPTFIDGNTSIHEFGIMIKL